MSIESKEGRGIIDSLKKEASAIDEEKARRREEEAKLGEARKEERKTRSKKKVLDLEDLRREELRKNEAIKLLNEARVSFEAQIREAENILEARPEMAESVRAAIQKLKEEIKRIEEVETSNLKEIEVLHKTASSAIEDPEISSELAEDLYEAALLSRAQTLINEQDDFDEIRKELNAIWSAASYSWRGKEISSLKIKDPVSNKEIEITAPGKALIDFLLEESRSKDRNLHDLANELFNNQAKLCKLLFELEDKNLSEDKRIEIEKEIQKIKSNFPGFDFEGLPMRDSNWLKDFEMLPQERKRLHELKTLASFFGLDKDKHGSQEKLSYVGIKNRFTPLLREREDEFVLRHRDEAITDPEYVAKLQEEARADYLSDVNEGVKKLEEGVPQWTKESLKKLELKLEELPRLAAEKRARELAELQKIRDLLFGPNAEEYRRILEEHKKIWEEKAAKEKLIQDLEKDRSEKLMELSRMSLLDKIRGRKSALELEIEGVGRRLEEAKGELEGIEKKNQEFWSNRERLEMEIKKLVEDHWNRPGYFDGSEESKKKIEEFLRKQERHINEWEAYEKSRIVQEIDSLQGRDLSDAKRELKRRKSQFKD